MVLEITSLDNHYPLTCHVSLVGELSAETIEQFSVEDLMMILNAIYDII